MCRDGFSYDITFTYFHIPHFGIFWDSIWPTVLLCGLPTHSGNRSLEQFTAALRKQCVALVVSLALAPLVGTGGRRKC